MLLPGVLAFGLLCLLYFLLKKLDGDQEGGQGGTVPPRYNLRMRPTRPGIDPTIYKRY